MEDRKWLTPKGLDRVTGSPFAGGAASRTRVLPPTLN